MNSAGKANGKIKRWNILPCDFQLFHMRHSTLPLLFYRHFPERKYLKVG